MSDERTYDDEVDYVEEDEDILEEDIIEEVDDDDGMDGEIAEAGMYLCAFFFPTLPHSCPPFSFSKGGFLYIHVVTII